MQMERMSRMPLLFEGGEYGCACTGSDEGEALQREMRLSFWTSPVRLASRPRGLTGTHFDLRLTPPQRLPRAQKGATLPTISISATPDTFASFSCSHTVPRGTIAGLPTVSADSRGLTFVLHSLPAPASSHDGTRIALMRLMISAILHASLCTALTPGRTMAGRPVSRLHHGRNT